VKEDIVHILCVGHFVIRAKHSLELKGQVIWDLSLSGRYLPQSATQPQNYDQSESKKTHVVSLYEMNNDKIDCNCTLPKLNTNLT